MKAGNQYCRLALWLLLASFALAQTPGLEPDRAPPAPGGSPGNTPVSTVTFEFALSGAQPDHYSFAVESSGRAVYRSSGLVKPDSAPGDPYFVKLTLSRSIRDRIFDLAAHAHHFQGNFDYTKGRIANTGSKTLGYGDDKRSFRTTYNYSTNAAIQEVTKIFQDISSTLESGRRLEYLYRYDKLGLDAELKQMVEMAKDNNLEELQAIQPVLQKIASDSSVLNISRVRAQGLLARIPPAPGS